MNLQITPVTPNLKYVKGKLQFELVDILSIVRKLGTPVYIYSKSQIVENYKNYDEAFSGREHMICFAMKSNSNFEILKIIHRLGGGVDVTSGGEIYRAINAGIKPQKIVYAGVGKTEQEIEFAISKNIFMFNVESKDEVDVIEAKSKSKNKNTKIAVRINPEVRTKTHSYISTGEEGTKFGIPIQDAIEFFKYLKTKKFVTPVGLHFHIGSQITEIEPFLIATKKVVSLIPYINSLGIKISYLNIGGGLGIRYFNETPPSPKKLISTIIKHIPQQIKIICEPGRYIVGNSGILVSKVLYHKKVRTKNFLIIDASMTDLIRPAFYNAYHNIIPVKLPDKIQPMVKYDIVGPVCETSDFLGKQRMLPEIKNGEYVVIECTGAYGFSMSSNYNSRVRCAEVMVDKGRFYTIRDRETYHDLILKEKLTKDNV